MSLNLKLVKGTEMRKVENPPADMAGLCGLITSLFGITDFNIRYIDEEGDTITISTDIEVQLAYHEAHRFGLKNFKIYVDQKDLSDARSEAARQLELLAASVASLNKQISESMHPDQPVTAENLPPEEILQQAQKAFKAFKKHSKAHKEPKPHKPWRPIKFRKLIRALVRREADAHFGHEHLQEPVWPGVTCDSCGVAPIIGLRYKCAVCANFDFCEACERSEPHPHPFVKLRAASQAVVQVQADLIGRKDFKNFKKLVLGKKSKGRFVDHVNFKESETVPAGVPVHKIWRVKNTGSEPWPLGTELVFCKGDLRGESTSVGQLAPGEEADVGVVLNVPEQAGRYYAVWRLSSPNGQRFGDKLHVLLHAETPEDLSVTFMEKLRIMEGMGFIDSQLNQAVLEETGGDVNLAITRLVNQ
jgi:hypothetical protein